MSNDTNTTMGPTPMPTVGPTATPTAMYTEGPTIGPTATPTELYTGGPTAGPTATPAATYTGGPTPMPTELITSAPTPNSTEGRISVIRLPDYTSHDTVDGFFIGTLMFIVIVMMTLCLQKINVRSRRLIGRRN